MISFDCKECQRAPELKEQLACETPASAAVWEDGENEFYNCPLRFIPSSVSDWYAEHSYNERYHTALPYGKQSVLFVEALTYYMARLTHFQRIAAKQKHSRGE